MIKSAKFLILDLKVERSIPDTDIFFRNYNAKKSTNSLVDFEKGGHVKPHKAK